MRTQKGFFVDRHPANPNLPNGSTQSKRLIIWGSNRRPWPICDRSEPDRPFTKSAARSGIGAQTSSHTATAGNSSHQANVMKARMSLIWLVAGLVLLGSASPTHPVRIIWNRTDSVPRGLYTVRTLPPEAIPEIGDMVAFSPALQDRAWLENRGYIGKNWPLLKYVVALPDDTVCRQGATIRINHLPVARALELDDEGRPLPDWQGCYKLAKGDVFLLAPHPRSLDGRYMGIQRSSRILGNASCLLACGKSRSPSFCAVRRPQATTRSPI